VSRRRNQFCGILLQSAHGFRFCEGLKFAISHWLGGSPLTQCWRYRAACDNRFPVIWNILTNKQPNATKTRTLPPSPELRRTDTMPHCSLTSCFSIFAPPNHADSLKFLHQIVIYWCFCWVQQLQEHHERIDRLIGKNVEIPFIRALRIVGAVVWW